MIQNGLSTAGFLGTVTAPAKVFTTSLTETQRLVVPVPGMRVGDAPLFSMITPGSGSNMHFGLRELYCRQDELVLGFVNMAATAWNLNSSIMNVGVMRATGTGKTVPSLTGSTAMGGGEAWETRFIECTAAGVVPAGESVQVEFPWPGIASLTPISVGYLRNTTGLLLRSWKAQTDLVVVDMVNPTADPIDVEANSLTAGVVAIRSRMVNRGAGLTGSTAAKGPQVFRYQQSTCPAAPVAIGAVVGDANEVDQAFLRGDPWFFPGEIADYVPLMVWGLRGDASVGPWGLQSWVAQNTGPSRMRWEASTATAGASTIAANELQSDLYWLPTTFQTD